MTNNNDNNLINSNSYVNNNNLILSQEFMFYYDDSKFLWKELMKISTKYIERSRDISLIEPYVQNILSSRLHPDDIDLLSNEYIVQLVTLLQLTGQYLVYTQKKLESDTIELKERINDLEYEHKESERLQKMVNDLRRQNQEKDFIIKTYQDMIREGYGLSGPIVDKNLIDDENINLRSKKDGSDKQKYYFCKICSGKKFKSQQFLDDHMQRRHFYEMQSGKYEETKVNKNKRYKQTFDEKLNSMREYFENMIKETQDNKEFDLINKKIDDISSKIITQNTNSNFGSNFNYNYTQKDFYHRNMNNQIPFTSISSPKKDQNENQDEEMEKFRKEVKNMINNYKNELDNQINDIRNLNEKNKANGSHSNNSINNIVLNRNRTEGTNIKHSNNYYDNKINNESNIYAKSLTESYQKNKMQNNQNPSYIKQNASSSKKVSFYDSKNDEKKNIVPNNLTNINSGNDENNVNNTNVISSQKQNNNSNNYNDEDDKNNILKISKGEDQYDGPKIVNEEINKDENNNKENGEEPGIYDKEKNTNSPKFSVNEKFKESMIINENMPKSDITSFYLKYKRRDDGYEGDTNNYIAIELPSKYNVDNTDKIKDEVKTKFDFGNVDFQGVNGLIKQFPQEVDQYNSNKKYEIDIYKALGLDEVFQGYNDYKQKYLGNSQSNSNNISRNKNNITGINNSTTNNNFNNDISRTRGNIGASKTKNYMLESSISLLEHNMGEKTQNPYLRDSEI